MGWAQAIYAAATLFLEILKTFEKHKDEKLAEKVLKADDSQSKQDAAVEVAKRMYSVK